MAPISSRQTWYSPPHKKTYTNGLPLPPSGKYHSLLRGWSSPSTTNLVLIVAELQCTGLYRAGYHPGCCLWGVGSGYTDTTKHKLTEGHREARKGEKKEREEGGRLHLKRNIIRVRRKGGGWREKEKDNGERSRMVQIDSLLCCSAIFFPCWQSIWLDLFSICGTFSSVMCIFTHHFVDVGMQRLFHSTFDISVVILGRSERICGPCSIYLIVWLNLHGSLRRNINVFTLIYDDIM